MPRFPHRLRPRSSRPALEPMESRALLATGLNPGALITLGGSIDAAGEADRVPLRLGSDRLRPSASGRSLLTIEVQAPDGSTLRPGTFRLIGPDGRAVGAPQLATARGQSAVVWLRPGDYTLEVRGRNGRSTGAYVVQARLTADFNRDRKVDGADLSQLRALLGRPGALLATYDLNRNGVIGAGDVSLATASAGAASQTITLQLVNATGTAAGAVPAVADNQVYFAVYGKDARFVDPAHNPAGWAYYDTTGAGHSLWNAATKTALTVVPTYTLRDAPQGVEMPNSTAIQSGQIYFGLGAPPVLPVNVGLTQSGLAVTSGGTGYAQDTTTVSLSGGTVATATLGTGVVAALNVTAAGSGYARMTTVRFTGGGGTGAAATATVDANGQVTALTITNPGKGYTTAPTVTIAGAGTGATGTVAITAAGQITNLKVAQKGTGYTQGPRVTFTGGGSGTGASAEAVVVGGKVTGLLITNPGQGYSSPPTVAFVGGGGTGATATARLTYGVGPITVNAGGSGYTSAPTVQLVGGGGTGATARVVMNGATVQSVIVTNPGSGYLSPPTLLFSGGVNGEVDATVSGGQVTALTLRNTGSGYLAAPRVTIVSSGTGAGATATADVQISGVAAPSPSNGSDPNTWVYWDFAEFTMNVPAATGVTYVNTDVSQVDQIGIPHTLQVVPADPKNTAGAGIFPARDALLSAYQSYLTAQNQPLFRNLLAASPSGLSGPLRIMAPSNYVLLNQADPLGSYFKSTINAVFAPGYSVTLQVPELAPAQFGAATASLSGQGGVAAVTVTNPGAAYLYPPEVQFTGGGGTGATARATINAQGQISGVTIVNPGSGYTSAPQVQFTLNYPSAPTKVATATASLDTQGRVKAIAVTQSGLGYPFPPNVILTGGGGSGAAGVAQLDATGRVTGVLLTDPGSGYTSAPAVEFTQGAAFTFKGTVTTTTQNGATYTVLRFVGQDGSQKDRVFDVYSPYNPLIQWAPGQPVPDWRATWQVFANSWVFADSADRFPTDEGAQKILGNIENQVVAAMNRGVALKPYRTWTDPTTYYPTGTAANWYAAFLHQPTVSIGGLAYGFAYDDQGNNSTDLSSTHPTRLTVTIGWRRPLA